MNRIIGAMLLVTGAALVSACGGPQKVLTGYSYASDTKSLSTLILPTGTAVGSDDNKRQLFDYYLRVCDMGADNTPRNCKDTKIVEKVDPYSL